MDTDNSPGMDVLAAVSLSGMQTIVLSVLGTVIVILLCWRVVAAWAKRSYGEIAIEIVAALIVGWFVFSPTSAMDTLASWRTSIFG